MLKQSSATRWPFLILYGAALWFLYLFGLTRTGLLGPDEPRYAAIGRAMAQTGDWITPRLWGHPWFEKPALIYWMTGAAFKAGLGPELAPRLPVALISIAFLIYFFFALRSQFGERAAFFATTILATCAGWLAYSHVAVPDLPMSAAFGAAMLTILAAPSGPRRAIAVGVLLGIAILAKGLVPLVLFLPAVWFLRRNIRELLAILSVAGLAAAPWYLAVGMRNGAPFLADFFGKQQFSRFFSGEFLHPQPFWFYVPVLAAGLFPWTPLALLLFSGRLYRDRRAAFLLTWFAFGFVFFSASRGKLPGYLLPLVPPLAALMGLAIDLSRERGRAAVACIAAGAVLLWLVPTFQDALPRALISGLGRTPIHFSFAWLVPVAALAALCGLLEFYGRRGAAVALLALSMTVLITRFIWQDFPALDREVSARARWIASSETITCIPHDTPFLRYSLDYYAGQGFPDCH